MPTCTYCNADVSPNAKTCPNCGDNLKEMRENERANFLNPILFIGLGVFLFFVGDTLSILGGLFCVALGVFAFFKPHN